MIIINNTIICWLENILFERFGINFYLIQKNNFLNIHLEGKKDFIQFDNLISEFYNPRQNLSCGIWDCSSQGYVSSLKLPLFTPGLVKSERPIIDKTLEGYQVHYDILGLVFWMLTRQEEIKSHNFDSHGRFPVTASHAFKNGYLNRPIVDEWLDILGQIILRLWPSLELKKHKFKINISHDVDQPFEYLFCSKKNILYQLLGDIVKRKNLKLAQSRYLNWYAVKSGNLKKDPFYVFDWIMDTSKKNNLTSTFHFIANNKNKKFDGDYSIEDPRIINLMKKIHQKGHKIGLHPSYNCYLNLQEIEFEFNKLKKICNDNNIHQNEWGSRMHYLRFRYPDTLQYLDKVGLNFDQSLNYANFPGFRCGTCFDYPAFDPINLKILNIRIKPLIAMESSISVNMKLGFGQEFISVLSKLKKTCQLVKGTFSLLWHNSEMQDEYQTRAYKKIIKN